VRYGLKDLDIQKIQSVFTQFPEIQKVIIYGSRAKGNFKMGSDIDLTIVGENLILD
jgi:predicted nucleotidyltransferase